MYLMHLQYPLNSRDKARHFFDFESVARAPPVRGIRPPIRPGAVNNYATALNAEPLSQYRNIELVLVRSGDAKPPGPGRHRDWSFSRDHAGWLNCGLSAR